MVHSLINYLNFVIILALFYLLSIFSLSIFGFSWFPDIITRLNLNEGFFNMYHFLWVTALYLSPFYFLLWALFLAFSLSLYFYYSYFFLLCLYCIYNTEVLDFVLFNWQLLTINTSLLQFNTLLMNNINKIHPFIFYSGTFLTFNVFILFFSLKPTTSFSSVLQFRQLYLWSPFSLIVSLVALFLGSWWAVQEGTWGGWWNWDPSETFGLLFTLCILVNLHTIFYVGYLSYWKQKVKLMTLILIFSYFFIQLNFDLVSHNFGVKFFYFFNNKLFFYLVIVLTLYLFVAVVRKQFIYNDQSLLLSWTVSSKNFTSFWFVNLSLISVNVLITLSLVVSFFILFNYFIWNFVNFNLFNLDLDRNLVNTFFVLTLGFWIFFNSSRTNISLLFILPFVNNFFFLVYFLLFNWRSYIFQLHQILSLVLILNLLSLNSSFILWTSYTFSENLTLGTSLLNTSLNTFTCDSIFVDKTVIYKTFFLDWFNSWNFFLYSNTLVTNTFFLTFSNSILVNFYELFSFSNQVLILIENNYTSTLPTLTVLLLTYYFLNISRLNLSTYY